MYCQQTAFQVNCQLEVVSLMETTDADRYSLTVFTVQYWTYKRAALNFDVTSGC